MNLGYFAVFKNSNKLDVLCRLGKNAQKTSANPPRLLDGVWERNPPRLRIKDIDFAACRITVRDRKNGVDRVAMSPGRLIHQLREHPAKVKAIHVQELSGGFGDFNKSGRCSIISPAISLSPRGRGGFAAGS